MTSPTSSLLIIGNEILSGRTQDKNLAYLATELSAIGAPLREVRVIPDIESIIIETVLTLSHSYTYVFTTGGIGPTHDDITSAAIAKAFGVPLVRHPDAEKALLAHYTPDQVNEARMKMADVPEGASLIANPVSAAPGFIIQNVHVMAGVPRIMQAMFDNIRPLLKGGDAVLSESITTTLPEGTIAAGLTAIQQRFADTDIGSYPYFRQGGFFTTLVVRSTNSARNLEALAEIRELIHALGGEETAAPGAGM
jgi:molybdenum cofactor synthesis domain-containing protein